MAAVIFAGGRGLRLYPYTLFTPKPLLKINSKTILEYQLEYLRKYNVREIYICICHLSHRFKHFFSKHRYSGLEIFLIEEKELKGNAYSLWKTYPYLKNLKGFYVLNGDILTDLDLSRLKNIESKYLGSIALTNPRIQYGVAFFKNNVLTDFIEKPLLKNIWINTGIYYFKPAIYKYLPKQGYIEKTLLPHLAKHHLLKPIKYTNIYFKNIETYKDLKQTQQNPPPTYNIDTS